MDTAPTIGDVARRTGSTERTLRYYEELGLLAPDRDAAGHRRYATADLDRLLRVRLLRELGTPLASIADVLAGDDTDLTTLVRRHLVDLDGRLAELARQRERVRSVEARLLHGPEPAAVGDEALLDLLAGVPGDEDAAGPVRRITLLVYRDLAAAHEHLVTVLGLAPGAVHEVDGRVVHAEVHAGDGVIWLHRESEDARLASPVTLGAATACLALHVDDVEAHHARVLAAGGAVEYPPTEMPYGVREYGVRDLEGHLWSFQQPLEQES